MSHAPEAIGTSGKRDKGKERMGEETFVGDVHGYGKWLMQTGQAVGSWHDTTKRTEEYQEFLWKHGKEYRDDVKRHNSALVSRNYGEQHEIFLAEQEMRSRTVGGSGISCTTEKQNAIREETRMGLGDHKNISILKKHQHAPIPWEVLDDDGARYRGSPMSGKSKSLNNQLGDEGYGVYQYLDSLQELVLFSSTKRKSLISLLQALQAFYVPDGRDAALRKPFRFLYPNGLMLSDKCTPQEIWAKLVSQHEEMSLFLPRAFISWCDAFMQANVLSIPTAYQKLFVQHLLRPFGTSHSETSKRMEHGTDIPTILDTRIAQFYTFVKKEYGLSVHIVDKDPTKNIAVISFEITHRYHIAIFFDTRPLSFQRVQHRLCKYMLDYMELLCPTEHGGDIKKASSRLDEALDTVAREEIPFSKDSGKIMKNMLEQELDAKKGKKTSRRKMGILKMKTTGIVEIVIYPCSCRRISNV